MAVAAIDLEAVAIGLLDRHRSASLAVVVEGSPVVGQQVDRTCFDCSLPSYL